MPSHSHTTADLPTIPVSKGGTGLTTITAGKALIGNGTSAVATRTIKNMTAVGPIEDYSTSLMTTNTLAYWNGAYNTAGTSNLAYCVKGAFGTIVTKNTGDYAAASHTHSYLPLSGGTMTGIITTKSSTASWSSSKTTGHIVAGHTPGEGFAPIISTGLQSGGYGKLGQVTDEFGLYAYSSEGTTPSLRIVLKPESSTVSIYGHTIPYTTSTYNLGNSTYRWNTLYSTAANISGTTTTAGLSTSDAITLTGADSGDKSTIAFTRTTYNYIKSPSGSNIGIQPGGLSSSSTTGYKFDVEAFYPGATNTYTLGKSDRVWKNIYATTFTGNLSGNATTATTASKVTIGIGSGDAYRAIVVTNGSNGLYIAGTDTGNPRYNYSTGDVKAASFTTDGGNFVGNLTGTASGNLPLTGGTLTGKLNMNGTAYPQIFGNGTYLAFGYNSSSSQVVVDSTCLRRGSSATVSLGSSSYPWSNFYASAATLTGALTISGTSAATAAIDFTRASYNYISAPVRVAADA